MSFHPLVDALKNRTAEFSTVTPPLELLNLHAWACQYRRSDLRRGGNGA